MRGIRDSLHELVRTAQVINTRQSKGGEPRLLGYKSKLATIIKDLPDTEFTNFGMERTRQAKINWQYCKETGQFERLSKRDCRILCGTAELLRDAQFLDYITGRLQETPRFLGGLLLSHHRFWKQNPLYSQVTRILEEGFRSYSGTDRSLRLWKQNIENLVGDNSVELMARELVALNGSYSYLDLVDRYKLRLEKTAFGEAVHDSACELLGRKIRYSKNFDEKLWLYVLNKLLAAHTVGKGLRKIVLAQMIHGVENYGQDNESRSRAIELLKDYLLIHVEFGDPRVYPAKWLEFEPEAMQMFIAWLSEEDIRLFFETIMENSGQGRKDFWLKYIHCLQSSRVVLSHRDRQFCVEKLRALEKKGRVFRSWSGNSSSSVFILGFGEYVVVEFSEVNNSCFVYGRREFEKYVGEIPGKVVRGGPDLKKESIDCFKFKQPHSPNPGWQNILKTKLAQIGIRQGK